MLSTRKLLTITLAATTLAIGSLAATGQASAKGGFGGWHGGHGWHGGPFYRWHGHRWGHRFYGGYGFASYSSCYWVKKPFGVIKVCPSYDY